MDINIIIEIIQGGISLNNDKIFDVEQLIKEIKSAKEEIDKARSTFNNVCDDALIEVAIYSEDVALKRYGYLVSIAKKRGICVTDSYVMQNNLVQLQE